MKSPPAPEGLLIVGYGSPLRGDDAVGLHAARILSRRGYQALAVQQLTPELADPISRARAVVFMDADAALPPATIAVTPISAAPSPAPLEHHSTPEALLILARDLYAATPQAWRIALGVQDFALGRRLSPAARTALRQALESIATLARLDTIP